QSSLFLVRPWEVSSRASICHLGIGRIRSTVLVRRFFVALHFQLGVFLVVGCISDVYLISGGSYNLGVLPHTFLASRETFEHGSDWLSTLGFIPVGGSSIVLTLQSLFLLQLHL
ncbi:hypothetical protein PMAYCL1PPCAC_17876, partial [Pristionchus mayeri]